MMMLYNTYLYIPILMFIMACFVFILNQKHLLITLLSLEYIVMTLFLLMFLLLNINFMEMYFLMVFLVFSVCEGALGLSILVSMTRTHGNNYFQSYSIMMC